jgi:hypothetical protein
MSWNSNNSLDVVSWIWEEGTLYPLNALIDPSDPLKPYLQIRTPLSINDQGQILAVGYDTRVLGNACPFPSENCGTGLYLLTPKPNDK